MKHLFIVNPAAGKRGSTATLEEHIHQVFGSCGADYEIVRTNGAGGAERLSRAACERGADIRIYACGGDGTLCEVVNGAAGFPHAAVTNVPKGTGNDFLKIFGPDKRQRFADLAALRDGPQAEMDLIDCNGKLGIGIVCAGVDARIAADVDRYKRIPLVTGAGAYILSLIVNVLFKGIARPAAVTVDGKTTVEETAIICVCNGRYYGGGFMPVGDAEPDDGLLDILLVPKVSRLTFFRLVGKYAKGLYRDYPQYIHDYHTNSITFSAQQELIAVVDGEVMRSKSFTVRLSERKINFFYPADLTYHVKTGTLTASL